MIKSFLTLSVSVLLVFPVITFADQQSDTKVISCSEALNKVNHGAMLVDVRTTAEFADGALPGALNVPHDQIGARLNEFPADKNRVIVVYCKSGRRSEMGRVTLVKNGYRHVVNAGAYTDLQKCFKGR